jgi:hypothetical protein
MIHSDNLNELATALAKAQGEFTPASMTATNPFLKNKYADLGAVISAAKASCAKNGLSVTQPASTDGDAVTVTTLLMHSSGQWISSEMTLPLGKESGRSIAQAAGSIITYLRRYSLSAMLGIYADEDTDGNEAKAKPAQAQPKRTAEQTIDELGYPPEPALPTGPEAVAHAAPMTVDEAENMLNSKGIRYGSLDNDKLSYMANSLAKIAARTPEQESKLLAIQIIFADRQEHTGMLDEATESQ